MRIGAGAAVVLGLALAGAGQAQDIVNPTWAAMPDSDAMAEVYPEFASMISLEGDVNLRCIVAPDGTLSLCRVNLAVPEALGFDEAALALAPRFRVNPREVDGEATKSSVQFTIRFRMEPEEAPPPWTGAEPSPGHIAAAGKMLEAMMGPDIEEAIAEELATLELNVSPDRESRVRAMLQQVEAEYGAEEKQATALAMARLLSPEQLADIEAGRAWPPRPTEEELASAGDLIERVADKRFARLRELYCAEFDCSERPPVPVF
jgi:TonB family protein